MNINIRNKISFFEVHWDMNMQLVRDQIYYNALLIPKFYGNDRNNGFDLYMYTNKQYIKTHQNY